MTDWLIVWLNERLYALLYLPPYLSEHLTNWSCIFFRSKRNWGSVIAYWFTEMYKLSGTSAKKGRTCWNVSKKQDIKTRVVLINKIIRALDWTGQRTSNYSISRVQSFDVAVFVGFWKNNKLAKSVNQSIKAPKEPFSYPFLPTHGAGLTLLLLAL